MDVLTAMLIGTGMLFLIFLCLLVVLAIMPPKREPRVDNTRDLMKIKNQIEQEAVQESAEELAPYTPVKLNNRKKI